MSTQTISALLLAILGLTACAQRGIDADSLSAEEWARLADDQLVHAEGETVTAGELRARAAARAFVAPSEEETRERTAAKLAAAQARDDAAQLAVWEADHAAVQARLEDLQRQDRAPGALEHAHRIEALFVHILDLARRASADDLDGQQIASLEREAQALLARREALLGGRD